MPAADEGVQFQDSDHDGLDDRLLRTDHEARSVDEILGRLEHLELNTLPEPTLVKMERDIREEQAKVMERARALERKLHRYLVQGEARMLEPLRTQMRHLKREHEELEDDRLRVYGARQQQIVRRNMVRKLGSEARADWLERIVLGLIVVVLGLLFYDFAFAPSNEVSNRIFIIDAACCTIFMTEFLLRLHSAEDRRWFFRHNWIDFVTSIPIPGEAQAARFGRVARLARVLRVMRLVRVFRVVFFFWRGMDKLQNVMDVKLMKRSLRMGIIVMFLGAFIIWVIEGNRNAAVGSIAEGLWWSFTTVVTGGFADIYNPETATGRFLTILLIVTGMILVGVFTATLTSLYVGDDSEELALLQNRMDEKMNMLNAKLDQLLKSEAASLKGSGGDGGAGGGDDTGGCGTGGDDSSDGSSSDDTAAPPQP